MMNLLNNNNDGYDVTKNNQNNKYKNQGIKNFLFGDISSPKKEDKNDNSSDENKDEIQEDKITTFVVEETILDDIKNVFGNNLSKKEYVFNSLNSSIISNFSFSQNESPSYLPQFRPNQFSVTNPQTPNANKNSRSHKKALKNIEIPTYLNSSTNNSSIPTKCTCKNSNCFKLYCECFANGRYCDNCSCVNCKNIIENKELRNQKYDEIISKNPKALQKINSTKRSWTCKCKNSSCLKKYCDCFQNGRSCTSKCKCINCFNKNNNNRNNGGDRKTKVKRIRGIKNNTVRNDKEQNNENEINEVHEEEDSDDDDEKEKEKKINLSTPKKRNNYWDKNEIYVYYDRNQSSTAAMTGKKERKKIMNTRTENKNKSIYTKLQMD